MKMAYWCIPFVKKFIYSKEKFQQDFSIDVCPSDPVTIDLGVDRSEIRIALNAQNKSEYLDITFDRALVSLTFGYAIISEYPIIKPCLIDRKKDCYMSFGIPMNIFQRRKICNWLKRNKKSEHDFNLRIDYQITSDLHSAWVHTSLDRRQCRVVNQPKYLKKQTETG